MALSETERPERPRVFCLAVTNADRSGIRPTTWSSAIDQEAAGVTEIGERAPRRLFVVSAGNAPNPIEVEQIVDGDAHEIEDPAQAWNAITVGGYTDRINIQEPEFSGYAPYALYAHLDAVGPGRVPVQAGYRDGSRQSCRLAGEDGCL